MVQQSACSLWIHAQSNTGQSVPLHVPLTIELNWVLVHPGHLLGPVKVHQGTTLVAKLGLVVPLFVPLQQNHLDSARAQLKVHCEFLVAIT